MRKFSVLLVSVIMIGAFTGSVFANEQNTGCGIGTMIFKGKEGLIFQVLAVTTNGTLGNQTFGITTGTLECEKPQSFASNQKLNKYVADNMDNLAMNIAKGNGEYLDTLAVLMEIPDGKKPVFYATLQNNFSNIYSSENVTQTDVLNQIENIVSQI